MDLNSVRTAPAFDNVFRFESYGVKVRIESNSPSVLERASATAQRALLGNTKPSNPDNEEHFLRLELHENGECSIIKDGICITRDLPDSKFFRYFDSLVRIMIAEFADSVVFIHSGVVGWKGKGILIPGDSFTGKSTLVSELIKSGAEYYSDEYAVLDADGLVHPYARCLSIRGSNELGPFEIDVEPAQLNAKIGQMPVPVGLVLFAKYDSNAAWLPEFLSPGIAAVEMVNYTIPIRQNPEFAMRVLRNTLSGCKIIKSNRGDVSEFVPFFLEFVDKTIF